jgi:hypothetical protein
MSRFCAFLLVAGVLCAPRFSSAQKMLPRAGQNFTFGIILGPDHLIGDSIASEQQTVLTLTVVSAYSGCGVISSPSGYIQDFTFIPGSPTIIDLPYRLMHLNDFGKTNKGLLVHTTAPVNLVLHDYVPQAGDATQILPDDALDTSYIAFGWGIWDDPGAVVPERNNNEFLITAEFDSTLVTITPSVTTLLGEPDSIPFTIRLDRGQCYIEKADTSGHPSITSLSGSRIRSTKPISVIAGLTCGYVPVGEQSCNELMDEMIGRSWWGSHFFVQPLGNSDSGVEIVLTNDVDFYAQIGSSGFLLSTNGRIDAEFPGAAEIHTFDFQRNPVRVEAQQLTRGSSFYDFNDFTQFIGDPTLVTVLDTAFYTDTIVWNTPTLLPDNAGNVFVNFAPIICPTADLRKATLDGTPLSFIGVPSVVINGSGFSAINPVIQPGEHTLISPDPLIAQAVGFNAGDAYSFMPGTAGSEKPKDTVSHRVVLRADSAQTCNDLIISASLGSAVLPAENLISLSIPITYDPSTLHLLGIQPGAIPNAGSYSVDSSTPGFLTITMYGDPFITGSDLFKIIFVGWRSISATTVGKTAQPSACGDDSELLVTQPVTFAIAHSTDSLDKKLLISNSTASVCEPMTIAITTDSILTASDGFIVAAVEATFNTATEQFISSTPGGLLKNIFYLESGKTTGDYKLTVPSSGPLTGSDTLVLLQFTPQNITATDVIHVTISYLRCGDTLSQTFTLTFPIVRNADTSHTKLAIATSSVSLSDQALADISLSGLPGGANVTQFDLYLTYNHNVLTYDHTDLSGTLAGTWPAPALYSGLVTDTLHFTSLAALPINSGILAHVWFKTYVSDSSYSPIAAISSLPGTYGGCPIVFLSPQVTTLFLGKDLCGDTILRSVLQGKTLVIDRAEMAGDGMLHLTIQAPTAAVLSLSLTDILGRTLWSGTMNCAAGTNDRELALPQSLPTGLLILRAQDGEQIRSKEVLWVR